MVSQVFCWSRSCRPFCHGAQGAAVLARGRRFCRGLGYTTPPLTRPRSSRAPASVPLRLGCSAAALHACLLERRAHAACPLVRPPLLHMCLTHAHTHAHAHKPAHSYLYTRTRTHTHTHTCAGRRASRPERRPRRRPPRLTLPLPSASRRPSSRAQALPPHRPLPSRPPA